MLNHDLECGGGGGGERGDADEQTQIMLKIQQELKSQMAIP